MARRTIGRMINPKTLSLVSTLDLAFATLMGSRFTAPASAEDRLLARAANDAAQR